MPDESEHSHGSCCGPATREKLLEAAGVVFAEKGLYGARIRDITDMAGVNVAAVNYYFHDKVELYTRVLLRAHEFAAVALKTPVTAPTPEGRIRQLLTAMLTAALDPTRPTWHTRLLARELIQPTPALESVHRDLHRPGQRLRDAVWEVLPDLSEEDATLIVCNIIGQSIFYVHHRHLISSIFPTLPEPSTEKLISLVVDFSLAALKGLAVLKTGDE